MNLLLHAAETSKVKQSHLGRHVSQPLAGIIIGNQDFGIFASVVIPLDKIVDATNCFDLITCIDLSDKGTVIVADQPFAKAGCQGVPEPRVILFPEFNCVVSFRLIVGRVAVNEGIFPVILPDQFFKILVLNDCVLKPPAALPN